MLVQMYYPQSLSPSRLDKYLASGWFRSSYMLFRSQLMCLDEDIYSLVNIRLRLEDYQPKKSLRRVWKRCHNRFQVVIRPAIIDKEKEALYQQQKPYFQGFIFDSLELFMNANLEKTVFETWEISVYDTRDFPNKLVAVSFFDIGKTSLASIIALYDRANYAKYSLGTYTMLLEIEYGIKHHFKFYYSGYILEHPSPFDYKLKVGNCQYYNWKGRWKDIHKLSEEIFPIHTLKQKINALEKELKRQHIPCQKFLYPFFSMGYLRFFPERFLKNSLYLFCFYRPQQKKRLVIEYDLEREIYTLSEAVECPEYGELLPMNLSQDFSNSMVYYPNLLSYHRTILSSEIPHEIIDKVLVSRLIPRSGYQMKLF